jgi:hypothetical protein
MRKGQVRWLWGTEDSDVLEAAWRFRSGQSFSGDTGFAASKAGRERSPTRLQRCCYSIGVSKRTEEMSGASKR